MRRTAAIATAVAAVALATAAPAGAGTFTVTVGPAGSLTFSPANQTIQAGDTVHWVWASGPHSATSGSPPGTPDGRWDSGIQDKPFSYDTTFSTPGTFRYFCAVHYAEGMLGTITVVADEAPTAVYSVATASPVVGQPVGFDGSASSDPDGSLSSYSWDFGDGSTSGSGAQPAHTYALPGTYEVTLTAADTAGQTASVAHQVTVASAGGDESPVAAFSISPASPLAGQPVSFTGSASNDPDGSIRSYSWDFGDGSAAGSGPQPAHTYGLAGRYAVRLTVTDSDNQAFVDSQSVTVGQVPPSSGPTAAFSAAPGSPVAGEPVTFDASGSGDPTGTISSYHWAFGDGSPNQTGVTVHHVFMRRGSFAVSLTVTDRAGQTAGHTSDMAVRRPSRISHVRLRSHGHRRFLEVRLTGAGRLWFRLFGSSRRYAVRRAKTLRVAVRPPSSLLDRLKAGHAVGVPVKLHFTPSAGSDSVVRITLRISPGRVRLVRVRRFEVARQHDEFWQPRKPRHVRPTRRRPDTAPIPAA